MLLKLGRGISLATGMWTAVSGAMAQAHTVDTVANNLANADTLGFKKDAPAFREYMATLERDQGTLDVAPGPIKERSLNPLNSRDQAFVVVDGTYSNFKQGNLRVTQAPLDVALDGPGFLEVSTPAGIRYTRQGSLKMAMDGRLVTTDGNPVLAAQPGGLAAALPGSNVQSGQGGLLTQGGVATEQMNAARAINLRDRSNISINEQGEIYSGGELVGKLSVVEFGDVKKLRKVGSQYFENPELAPQGANAAATNGGSAAAGGAGAQAKAGQTTLVRQGMIETSNVNPVEEMTNLIKANRLYEQGLKSIRTYDELMRRESNEIGKL